jgi:hypothetical protein
MGCGNSHKFCHVAPDLKRPSDMAQGLAQACESLKQDCTATGQAGLLMAQVEPASAQVWKRNGHLVRSVLVVVYRAIL